MKTKLIVLALLISSLSFGQTQQESTKANAKAKQEILAIEDEYMAFVRKNDFKGLAAWFDRTALDDSGAVLGNGEVDNKANALKGLRAMADKKDPTLNYETIKQDERQVNVYGDAAIFSAKATRRTQGEANQGKAAIQTRFTHFFVKQSGQWKLAKAHMTNLATK